MHRTTHRLQLPRRPDVRSPPRREHRLRVNNQTQQGHHDLAPFQPAVFERLSQKLQRLDVRVDAKLADHSQPPFRRVGVLFGQDGHRCHRCHA
jgi:hypothetical protein